MSLETVADARRMIELSRAEYDGLVAYLEALPPEGWTEQSAAADWQVYQVVSHIGSQPAIHGGMIRAGLLGEPPMTDADRRAIWDRFDAMTPEEVYPAFRANNEAFIAMADALTEEQLGASMPWLGGPAPLATVLAGRLNEQALHAWDIRQAHDSSVKLTAAAVPDLLELNLTPGRLGGLVKPDQAPALVGKAIQFLLTDPTGALVLTIGETRVAATDGQTAAPNLTVTLPTEAMVRLLWGRCNVAAGISSGELTISEPSLAAALQALLPGR
ncbi:MAG: maleylpyruvate isomerase family mycothiol-dependent enzyme [Chloroflexi bacterium]|nr:maleylpyruvate isomerase family mycothiol-dependent enzyme [Chloroflexota bacterium]